MSDIVRSFFIGNVIGLTVIAVASYFDVYSHRHLFLGTDPWWNPAHLMLYAGFIVLMFGVVKDRPRGAVGKLSFAGIALIIAAAIFNEFWHRVLLFGNPLPEPFPIEPPHALLAVGIIVAGLGALLYPFQNDHIISGFAGKVALPLLSGSLWLIIAGSALYVGGAYESSAAYLFAVGAASFSASLFLAYPTGLARKFGYSTLSYLWFMLVYYTFFLSLGEGLPLGVALVALIDFMIARGRIFGLNARYFVLVLIALLYGVVYYPILPFGTSVAVNFGLLASVLGVTTEFVVEKTYLRSRASQSRGLMDVKAK